MKLILSDDALQKACDEYANLKYWVNGIKIIVTGFMTCCNVISKLVIMWIIQKLSMKKKSTEATFNFIYLVVVTSFQSIVIFLLLNAKLDFIPYFGKHFKNGKMRDFTWDWYKELGGLFIMRMIVMSLNPLFGLPVAGPVKAAKKLWFQKGLFNKPGKNMWDYYKIEKGSEFQLEQVAYKLAGVVLLAFLFGPAIPILFVLALMNVVLCDLCLRYQLAYHHKKPFNYSNELNNMLIKFCAAMPVIYSAVGSWMYSNR